MEPLLYRCRRAPQNWQFNGNLCWDLWSDAEWTSDFVDIEGAAKPLPRLRTRAKMMWTDEHLLIGAEMEEPDLWATLTEHDSVIFQDNDFEVFIDPDGDARNYFEFEVNALGTNWDLFLPLAYRDQGSADNSWEAHGLIQKVTLRGTLNDPSDRDEGWTVELAFPWDCFRHQGYTAERPEPDSEWRINFSRVQWELVVVDGRYEKVPGRREDNWVWSPQGVIDMHQPEQWGRLLFED